MSAYEPGTVVVATVRGVKDVRVIKSLAPVHCWFSAESVNNSFGHTVNDVIDVRPLVVLDLGHYKPHAFAADLREVLCNGDFLARQIEAQTRPPKPAEPTGLGAVVKDREGRTYVRANLRAGDVPWLRVASDPAADPRYGWSEIDAVEVLSEGVAPS